MHVTQDGGASWTNVTPPQAPEWCQINCIASSPFEDGGCYVAATRYKLDDFHPYLYATSDFGKTWREITGGIDPNWFTRCIRPDPVVKGLLYCGSERTVWMSYDDGRRWQRLQRSLPITPITDLCIKDGALIAATQGRSFWSFDGLEHLRQLSAEQALASLHVFDAVTVTQYPGDDEVVAGKGRNPRKDLRVRFYVGGDASAPVTERAAIEVKDVDGKVVFTRATDATKDDEKFTVKRGMNEVVVTWKSLEPKVLDGMILWNGRGRGPRPAPFDYPVTVTLGETTKAAVGRIAPDPRTTATAADLQARFRLARDCSDSVTKAHEAIEAIRSLRTQMQVVVDRTEGDAKTKLDAKRVEVAAVLTAIEETLYQTKAKSSQDVLNFPIRLTDKLLGVMSAVDRAEFGPTVGQTEVAAALIAAIGMQLGSFDAAKKDAVAQFNALAHELAVPHVK